MKRIVYISSIAFSDVDISMLAAVKDKYDVTYVVLASLGGERGCALDLRNSNLKPGLNKAKKIHELSKFGALIDLNKMYVFYKTVTHAYHPKSFIQEYELFKLIKKGNYDIVHITSFPSFLNPYYFPFRKRLVLTVHDPLPHFDITYKWENLNRKSTFKYVRNYILLNKAQNDDFIRYYNLNRKKNHIYDSQLSSYTYLRLFPSEDNTYTSPYILFFGNITPYKGVEYLLNAMKIVHQKHPELNLIVAGGGKYYFDTSNYNEASYITILNRFIPDEELASLISRSLFVVVPYVEATQSGVVMSAYAFDKPCIATNVGGLPEMVKKGEYGEIVEPKNSEQLADSIVSLFLNRERLTTYSNNIHRDYDLGDKSWFNVVNGLDTIYESIINENNN